jgi:phosphate transport system protein
MKTSNNLERVGDEATTIARRALRLNAEPQLKHFQEIDVMAKRAVQMLRAALEAFVQHDAVTARAIIVEDKEIDALNKQMQKDLAERMFEDPKNIGRCLNLMTVSKSLERIADHATNVAEEVVYLHEGRDIRHETNLTSDSTSAGRSQ